MEDPFTLSWPIKAFIIGSLIISLDHMGLITVLWGDRWIIMASVAFWVGHHRLHTTERYAKAQSSMRDPTGGPSFSDRVTHVREVASQQVTDDKGHSWQETARAACSPASHTHCSVLASAYP